MYSQTPAGGSMVLGYGYGGGGEETVQQPLGWPTSMTPHASAQQQLPPGWMGAPPQLAAGAWMQAASSPDHPGRVGLAKSAAMPALGSRLNAPGPGHSQQGCAPGFVMDASRMVYGGPHPMGVMPGAYQGQMPGPSVRLPGHRGSSSSMSSMSQWTQRSQQQQQQLMYQQQQQQQQISQPQPRPQHWQELQQHPQQWLHDAPASSYAAPGIERELPHQGPPPRKRKAATLTQQLDRAAAPGSSLAYSSSHGGGNRRDAPRSGAHTDRAAEAPPCVQLPPHVARPHASASQPPLPRNLARPDHLAHDPHVPGVPPSSQQSVGGRGVDGRRGDGGATHVPELCLQLVAEEG
mmetsp:Transcript_2926/g.7874  ORF Transcript_2926/g.7874 Transcript_2926/m.7874 type:complete len:349 (-) Transcript_2926:446-1492(-)